MSDIIQLLPDSVANQIAAGEVIQRPASIIKELVENSLDAGATHIQIVVEDAGKSLVQVIDNGCGMSETDARLSFERHATSKIKQASDLFALHTMGFRGEALASIAAVAQVELRTRTATSDLGTNILIEGSKVVNQEATSCPVGCNFAVRNLFFNVPARRKFLKSNQTEMSNIMAEFERIALAHSDKAFTLYSGQNMMFDLPEGNFRKRIINIFGRKIDSQLIPINADTSLAHISGYIGTPNASRRKNAHQYLFVNGRYMRHPYFAKAILTAYERLIPEGQQVPFFVKFEVDPSRIDVNIHPTKTEIKFEDDNAIFQILLAAVRESLGKYGAVPAIDFDVEGCPEIPTFGSGPADNGLTPPEIHINSTFNPFSSSETGQQHTNHHSSTCPSSHISSQAPVDWQQVYTQAQQTSSANHLTNKPAETFVSPLDLKDDENTLFNELPPNEQAGWNDTSSNDFIQYQGRYIVTPLNSGLALIDQHRAHTRILYEQYMRQLANHKAPSQRLLFPEMINLSPSESIIFDQLIPQLQVVGFDISSLGSGSYSIMAVPLGTEGIAPESLVSSILQDALQGEANASETVDHVIACALARKVAMPVGQALNNEEMSLLIEQLFTCSTPNLTPEGNPTLVVIDPQKLF